MSAAELQGVTHRAGAHGILDDVTLTIPEGSAFAIVGANGAGKSTLLKMLATVIRPTAGRIRVFGHDAVAEASVVRRLVGYVPDTFGSYPGLKVREYLEFFAAAHKLKRADATIDELLALVELRPIERQYLSTLSRGMKQRLAIARALLHDPLLLLLDEPTFGLDTRGRRDVLTILAELRNLGKTLIVSSHLLEDVAQLVSDVAVLAQGRVVAETAAADLQRVLEGPRRMRIEVANDPRHAQATLAGMDSVRSTEIQGQELSFVFTGGRYALPGVVRQLIEHDVQLIRFAEESTDLEMLVTMVQEGVPA